MTPPDNVEYENIGKLDGQIADMQSGNSKVLNQTWGLKLTVVYDDYWQQRFGSRSEERVKAVMDHVQTWYHHTTLNADFDLDYKTIHYAQGFKYQASNSELNNPISGLVNKYPNG